MNGNSLDMAMVAASAVLPDPDGPSKTIDSVIRFWAPKVACQISTCYHEEVQRQEVFSNCFSLDQRKAGHQIGHAMESRQQKLRKKKAGNPILLSHLNIGVVSNDTIHHTCLQFGFGHAKGRMHLFQGKKKIVTDQLDFIVILVDRCIIPNLCVRWIGSQPLSDRNTWIDSYLHMSIQGKCSSRLDETCDFSTTKILCESCQF